MIRKDFTWFACACSETMDMAMEAMCGKYKLQGYGGWLKLLEMLYAQENYEFDISKPYSYVFLSVTLMMPEEKVRPFINDLIYGYGMLQTDGVFIWSDKFARKMRYYDQKKQKLRDAGRKGGNARKANMDALANNDEACEDTPVVQQGCSPATATLSPFHAHNKTEHNKTEHNKTEQYPKPLKGVTTIAGGDRENEKTNTHLNSPPYEPTQTVRPAGAGPPPPITNSAPP